GGGNEPHVLDAVDGLLQRDQNRFDEDIGAGAGIRDGDHDGRRRDVGELGDRKGLDPQHPQKEEDNGDHNRQRWPMEDLSAHGRERSSLSPSFHPRSGCYSAGYFICATTSSGRRSSYSTLSPSRTCRVPSRTIFSSAPIPCLMTKMSSSSFWTTISR